MHCMPGPPYEDHTLTEILEQVGLLTGTFGNEYPGSSEHSVWSFEQLDR